MSKRKSVISKSRLALASAALAALQQPALAATDTATLTINATVGAQCIIDDAILDFGSFSGLGASTVTASADVSITCTSGTTASLAAASSAVDLVSGAGTITASLYSDSAMSNSYPTTPGSSVTYVGSGGAGTTPVYGKIVTSGSTTPGTYSGTVTLTVSY